MATSTPDIAKTSATKQPAEVYGTPEKLLSASYLSDPEKDKLLEQWAQDLEATLRASDENMAAAEPAHNGEMLRRVKDARRALDPERNL